MNPRENVLAAMRRQNPERVPFGLSFTPPMYDLFVEKTGAHSPAEYWDFDARWTYFRSPSEKAEYKAYFPEGLPEGSWIDEWGIGNVPGSMFHFAKMIAPLGNAQSVDEILSYPLPDFTRLECWQPIESDVSEYRLCRGCRAGNDDFRGQLVSARHGKSDERYAPKSRYGHCFAGSHHGNTHFPGSNGRPHWSGCNGPGG